LASDKQPDWNRQQGKQRELANQNSRDFAVRETYHPKRGQITAALRKGNTRTIVNDTERYDDSEAEVNSLNGSHHCARGLVKAGARVASNCERADARRLFRLAKEIVPSCRIHREVRSAHGTAFPHQAAELIDIHVGAHSGKISNQSVDDRIELRTDTLLDIDVNRIPDFDTENFRQFRGE
jgi:hypothetical protein